MYVDTQSYIDDGTVDAKLLIKTAHDLIKTNGWVQGSFGNRGTHHCIMGALFEASGMYQSSRTPRPAADAVKLLGNVIGLTGQSATGLARQIEAWNDDPARTKRHVLAIMKKAYRN